MEVSKELLGVDGGIGNFLDDIMETAKNSNGFVLEIGVATGTGSTVAINHGLMQHGDPLHISVDQRDYMVAKPMDSWWHFIIGDDRLQSTVDAVLSICKDRSPGLIFIDTDHDYAQMQAELALWHQLADYKTVWLFHDTHMFGSPNVDMVRAIEEFAAAHGWIYEDWRPEPHGLGRMLKR